MAHILTLSNNFSPKNCINLVPGVVQDLVCGDSSSPAELSFSWELPTLLGNEVVSYQVTVNRLEHRAGTREVIQSHVYGEFVEMKDASVSGLGNECIFIVYMSIGDGTSCGNFCSC